MTSLLRTYKCVQCFRRFKTHADLKEANRICPVCRVIDYTPPPPPLREPVPPSDGCLRRHGITKDDWWRMAREQGGLCAICRRRAWQFVIDHNHQTKEVRGLLCGGCNSALGIFGDDPETLRRAAAYLDEKGHYAGLGLRATAPALPTEGVA